MDSDRIDQEIREKYGFGKSHIIGSALRQQYLQNRPRRFSEIKPRTKQRPIGWRWRDKKPKHDQ